MEASGYTCCYHLTNIYTKENSYTDCVVNEKSVEISNELGQSLPG